MFVHIKVKPNSRENKVTRLPEGGIQISIKAPPQEGKANTELIAFIAKLLKVPKSGVIIEAGEGSRFKKIWIPLESENPETLFGLNDGF